MDCRKSVRDLTEQERRDFLTAVRELKRSGEYDTFVRTHFETTWEEDEGEWEFKDFPDNAHGGPAFLPWHRKFIREFEEKFQEQVPGVTLPYWDWTEEDHRSDENGGPPEELPVFKGDTTDPTDGLLGGNGFLDGGDDRPEGPFEEGFQISPPYEWECAYHRGSGDELPLERDLDKLNELPRPVTVEAALSIGDFYHEREFDAGAQSFHNVLEGFEPPSADDFPDDEPRPDTPRSLHNYMHGWVGGDMGPRTAPNDPIFSWFTVTSTSSGQTGRSAILRPINSHRTAVVRQTVISSVPTCLPGISIPGTLSTTGRWGTCTIPRRHRSNWSGRPGRRPRSNSTTSLKDGKPRGRPSSR